MALYDQFVSVDMFNTLIYSFPHSRFVSVILGEAWRQLPADQKEVFIAEAKALSSERKRLNPDCWKRRKTQPPGSGPVGAIKVEGSD